MVTCLPETSVGFQLWTDTTLQKIKLLQDKLHLNSERRKTKRKRTQNLIKVMNPCPFFGTIWNVCFHLSSPVFMSYCATSKGNTSPRPTQRLCCITARDIPTGEQSFQHRRRGRKVNVFAESRCPRLNRNFIANTRKTRPRQL